MVFSNTIAITFQNNASYISPEVVQLTKLDSSKSYLFLPKVDAEFFLSSSPINLKCRAQWRIVCLWGVPLLWLSLEQFILNCKCHAQWELAYYKSFATMNGTQLINPVVFYTLQFLKEYLKVQVLANINMTQVFAVSRWLDRRLSKNEVC